MSIFTVSPDFLKNIEEDERVYLRDILFVFTNTNAQFKVAKDTKSEILDIYRGIKNNADFIKTWLELMSYKPARFEKIDVDLSQIDCIETKFFELCHATINNNDLIVYSKQNLKTHICKNSVVSYKEKEVNILDKDDANVLLNKKTTTSNTFINSQVANNGSQIIDSQNN